jgi:hypothetical protein
MLVVRADVLRFVCLTSQQLQVIHESLMGMKCGNCIPSCCSRSWRDTQFKGLLCVTHTCRRRRDKIQLCVSGGQVVSPTSHSKDGALLS